MNLISQIKKEIKNKVSGQIIFKENLSNLGYLIVEKELNSGLNGFEIKDNIMFGAADKRRNGLVLYN